jgi:hypothetical protein
MNLVDVKLAIAVQLGLGDVSKKSFQWVVDAAIETLGNPLPDVPWCTLSMGRWNGSLVRLRYRSVLTLGGR